MATSEKTNNVIRTIQAWGFPSIAAALMYFGVRLINQQDMMLQSQNVINIHLQRVDDRLDANEKEMSYLRDYFYKYQRDKYEVLPPEYMKQVDKLRKEK